MKKKINKIIKKPLIYHITKWLNENVWITSLIAIIGLLLSFASILQNDKQFKEIYSSALVLDCSIPDQSQVSFDMTKALIYFDVICNMSNAGNKNLTISAMDGVITYDGKATGYEIVPFSKVENAKYVNVDGHSTLPHLLSPGQLTRYQITIPIPLDFANYPFPNLLETVNTCMNDIEEKDFRFLDSCLSSKGFYIWHYLKDTPSPFSDMGNFNGIGVRVFTENSKYMVKEIDFTYETIRKILNK
jgi:hypothetical protein